jgi:hypothetical protein
MKPTFRDGRDKMPIWISATLSFFGVIALAIVLVFALAVISRAFGAIAAISALGALILVGAPAFFYVVLGRGS